MTATTVANVILVVDDDAGIRESLRELLAEEGYVVVTAPDGKRAMELMRSMPVRLVLLDLMMPIMNGWDVFDQMRRDPELAQIPVCVVSADARAVPAGIPCTLHKPVRIESLLAAVEKHALN